MNFEKEHQTTVSWRRAKVRSSWDDASDREKTMVIIAFFVNPIVWLLAVLKLTRKDDKNTEKTRKEDPIHNTTPQEEDDENEKGYPPLFS